MNKELIKESYEDVIVGLKKAFVKERYITYTTKALLNILGMILEKDWTKDLEWLSIEENLPQLRYYIEKRESTMEQRETTCKNKVDGPHKPYPLNLEEYVTVKEFVERLNIFSRTFLLNLITKSELAKKFSFLRKGIWLLHPKELITHVANDKRSVTSSNKAVIFLNNGYDRQKLEDLMEERRKKPYLLLPKSVT